MKKHFLRIFTLIFLLGPVLGRAGSPSPLPWQSWSDSVFEKARRENKFILLDLEAVWCHWCHVMEETTYRDPKVLSLLQSRYLPVKVDQDSRPDLANRYLNYGWPATVIFAPDGTEILKRRGYIEPEAMGRLLEAVLKDPSPEKDSAQNSSREIFNPVLVDSLRKELETRHRDSYDPALGGLRNEQKFLDRDTAEYALLLAREGDKGEETRAKQTLRAAEGLIDPIWGGVYQYSTHGDWKHPHYEKLTLRQGEYLRIYALAYGLFRDPQDLKAALDIERYLKTFQRSPEGAFFASQDADLKPGEKAHEYFALGDGERRAQGIPRVDRNIYSRENGTVVKALALLYAATGDPQYLEEARQSARWILDHRSTSEGWGPAIQWWWHHRSRASGGFYHGERDASGPYLGDTLAMADAFLNLYMVTAEREWLGKAQRSAAFIERNFKAPIGFFTALPSSLGPTLEVTRDVAENIQAARFFNLLYHYTGEEKARTLSRHAMAYLALPAVATDTLTEPGILLADREISQDPSHLTIVGSKGDPKARLLFQEALRLPLSYKRVEWWDPKEGSMPNSDVQYPALSQAAAFVCVSKTCSAPIFKPDEVMKTANRLQALPGAAASF